MTHNENMADGEPDDSPLQEWVKYCLTAGRDVFTGWTEAEVRRWLHWHHHLGGLLILRQSGPSGPSGRPPAGKIIALAAGRRLGDRFTFEKVIASRPGALAELVKEFKRRWPEWTKWKLWRHCADNQYRCVNARWLNKLEQLK